MAGGLGYGNNLLKCRLSLFELTPTSLEIPFQQATNAIVVPPLPGRLDRRPLLGDRSGWHQFTSNRERDGVFAEVDDRQRRKSAKPIGDEVVFHEGRVSAVKLSVADTSGQRDRPDNFVGNGQPIVDHLGRPGWNLMIDRGGKNILHIPAVDSAAVAVDDGCRQPCSIGSDRPIRIRAINQTAGCERPTAVGGNDLYPDLV